MIIETVGAAIEASDNGGGSASDAIQDMLFILETLQDDLRGAPIDEPPVELSPVVSMRAALVPLGPVVHSVELGQINDRLKPAGLCLVVEVHDGVGPKTPTTLRLVAMEGETS